MTHHPGILPGVLKRGPAAPLLLGLLAGLAGPLRAAVAPPGAGGRVKRRSGSRNRRGSAARAGRSDLAFPSPRASSGTSLHSRFFRRGGDALPLQAKVLSRWPDGSIRWAHVLFPADLERQKVDLWRLEWNRIPAGAAPAPSPAARSR